MYIDKLLKLFADLDAYLWYSAPGTPTGDLPEREHKLSDRIKDMLKDIAERKLELKENL